VDYLRVHPGDFKGAIQRLRPELRGLYLSAYQSHLWNRLLARWLREHVPEQQLFLIRLRPQAMPFHTGLDHETLQALAELSLPLPSARWKPEPEDSRLELVEAVLADEGLALKDLLVRGVRDLFFSRGERPALCRPANFTAQWGEDELQRGKTRLTLGFDLPRGSYATLIIKAVTE
jgi:tRNA pseudouridine13 synthase